MCRDLPRQSREINSRCSTCVQNGVLRPLNIPGTAPITLEAGSAMTNTGLGFGVLGPLLMTSHGVRVSVGAPKQRAVLAMLLINRNRPVSVASLINAVWDKVPLPTAPGRGSRRVPGAGERPARVPAQRRRRRLRPGALHGRENGRKPGRRGRTLRGREQAFLVVAGRVAGAGARRPAR